MHASFIFWLPSYTSTFAIIIHNFIFISVLINILYYIITNYMGLEDLIAQFALSPDSDL